MCSFSGGMRMSSIEMEMPAEVACPYPMVRTRSERITVSFCPQAR